jgi:SAM-dependent methyltransferase
MPADALAPASAVERFLRDFHDRLPGGSSRAFAGMPVTDDTGSAHADSYAAVVQRLQDGATPPGPVLDLCCGDGHLLALLRATGRPVMGVDASTGELAAARARLGDDVTLHHAAGVTLHHARAQSLPLADASLAAVTCHMALMLLDDIDTVLAELRRVLQPGGRLLLLLPTRPADPGPAMRAFGNALGAHPGRAPAWQAVDFGAHRRDAAGWQALVARHIGAPQVTVLSAQQRLETAAAWRWMTELYDLHLRPDAAWPVIEADFHARLAPHLDAGGCTTLPHAYLLIDATRAPDTAP